jgi:hypothetical protein
MKRVNALALLTYMLKVQQFCSDCKYIKYINMLLKLKKIDQRLWNVVGTILTHNKEGHYMDNFNVEGV